MTVEDGTGPDVAPPAPTPSVVVAVLTYRRTEQLSALLVALEAQVRAVPRARVLVVDNDPEASARPVVAGHGAAEGGSRADYVHEPRPGIAAARNRALDEAADDDLLVFIDDDELPSTDWLRFLLACLRQHGPAAVVGPVVSRFAVEPDPWVRAGRFFDRRRPPTGTEVTVAATNNLLLDLAVLREVGLRFDERFGLSGGSDTLFTRQMAAAGLRMVWCDEAVVTDLVPAARVSRSWVLTRAVRSGNSWARTSLELSGRGLRSVPLRSRLLGQGLARLLAGGARWLAGALLGRAAHQARGARTAARGLGMLSGVLGWVQVEYGRGRSA